MKRSDLFSSAFSGTSAFPTRSAPTTGRRSDRRARVGFRLSIWLLKLGVEPHFGRPASPQDNGRHERNRPRGMIDAKKTFRRFAPPRTRRGETAGTKEE